MRTLTTDTLIDHAEGRDEQAARQAMAVLADRWEQGDATARAYLSTIGCDSPTDARNDAFTVATALVNGRTVAGRFDSPTDDTAPLITFTCLACGETVTCTQQQADVHVVRHVISR